MGRAHRSAQDQQPRRGARGDAAPPLEDVLALQKMAGNRAVASLARETAQKIKPWQQFEATTSTLVPATATVTLPGVGTIEAQTYIPRHGQQNLKELYFTSLSSDGLWGAFWKAVEDGKALGTVQLSWSFTSAHDDDDEVHHATLRNARFTSYQPGNMDASGGSVPVATWTLSFKSFTSRQKPRQKQRQKQR